LRVHLRQRVRLLGDPEQAIKIGQGVFESAIEDNDLAGDLLALAPRVVALID
jgi:hypothetical protein